MSIKCTLYGNLVERDEIIEIPQYLLIGSFDYSKEINNPSEIFLDQKYLACYFLNLVRARSFPPHSSYYFWEDGSKCDVTINNKRCDS